MNDSAKTTSDNIDAPIQVAPTSPVQTPIESPPPVKDPEVVATPIVAAQKASAAPAPLKI